MPQTKWGPLSRGSFEFEALAEDKRRKQIKMEVVDEVREKFHEGWLVVADSDLAKPWDDKISTEDIPLEGKTTHVVRCSLAEEGGQDNAREVGFSLAKLSPGDS